VGYERFNPDAIGKVSEPVTFEVTKERLIAYAEATNDPIEEHRSGLIAPPVFAIVPIFDSLVGVTLDLAPLSLIPRLVHGEQDFRFHRHIRPGDVLVSRARVIGYEGRPNGTRGTVYAQTHTPAGELLNEQWVTFFYRRFDAGETVGELGPNHSFDESLRPAGPVAQVSQHIDDDQTYRYSPAAGDPMPIHLDEDAAQAAGLPGIIAHGLCTMAFTSWAVLTEQADSRTERLARLAVRFAQPVRPGQDITTSIYRAGSDAGAGAGATSYAYETTVGDVVVVKDGWAVITD
jgi:acyl dehydratase